MTDGHQPHSQADRSILVAPAQTLPEDQDLNLMRLAVHRLVDFLQDRSHEAGSRHATKSENFEMRHR